MPIIDAFRFDEHANRFAEPDCRFVLRNGFRENSLNGKFEEAKLQQSVRGVACGSSAVPLPA